MTQTSQIKELEKLAKDILKLKNEQGLRKPLIIEFCGTPKAGKTTSIHALNMFLKRNYFKTVVIQEMATICPVRNKTDYFFNCWTMFSSLSETITQITVRKPFVDIIIVDRSIYDALCWFQWLHKNNYLSQEEFDVFVNFLVSSPMWTSLFDVTYIYKADPEAALDREFADLLTNKRGSIMNKPVLQDFNLCMDWVKDKYGNKFKRIEQYNTTNLKASFVNYDVTKNLLIVLNDVLTEKIGFFLEGISLFLNRGANKADTVLNRTIQYLNRKEVEKSQYIQPIPIAVITNKERDKVLVLKKNDAKADKTSPEHKKLLLYLGGHVRIEDNNTNGLDNLEIFKTALRREIREELNEGFSIGNEKPFVIYTPDNEKSKRHIGVCFIIEMDLEYKQFRPTQEEFLHKAGTTKSGSVMPINQLMKSIEHGDEVIESWSEVILSEVFGAAYQTTLF